MKTLKKIWGQWLKVAKIIGNFQGQVILTIFYFTIILPLGIVYSFFTDPLNINKTKNKKTNFVNFEYSTQNLKSAHKQY